MRFKFRKVRATSSASQAISGGNPIPETAITRRILAPDLQARIKETTKWANLAIGARLNAAPNKKMSDEVKIHVLALVELLKEAARENPDALFVFDTEMISDGSVKIFVDKKLFASLSIDRVFTKEIVTKYAYAVSAVEMNRLTKKETVRIRSLSFHFNGHESVLRIANELLNHNPSATAPEHGMHGMQAMEMYALKCP